MIIRLLIICKSKIKISVTAEDGTENLYIINITLKQKSNAITIIFVIILILALIAGGYYIYKKFIQSKMGDKYEYEKEEKNIWI